MLNGIGSAFAGGQAESGADVSKRLFEDNSELYLNLFLTQLKQQDPLDAVKTKELTEQMSQLNNSQQLIDVNKNLETLITANSTSQAASVASFINKDVKYLSNEVYSDGATPNEISYILDKSYGSASLEIRDDKGALINKGEGDFNKGTHSFFWDGTDLNGQSVKPGTYKITVYAENASGDFDEAKTLVSGTVTGVDFTNASDPVLTVGYGKGKVEIDLGKIAAINDFGNANTNNI